nr:hypothetical protein [Tanacetum cinerariifolium]
MSSFYEFTCYGCGGPSDTPLCYLCTCEQYGNILIEGACMKCNSGAVNSFVFHPTPESLNEVQSIFNPPPQSHYNIYLCHICESNSYYGYECSQRVPLVYKPEPCYSQSFGDNAYSHDSPDEFIKSSVANLVPSPSESEDEYECDVPLCDDFTTFSNLLFDADNDFSSSEDKSFSDENIPKEIYSNPLFDEEIIFMKIYPHHFNAESDLIESLLNHDSLIISSSSKIDSLLDEFTGELILLKSISSGIDETDCDPDDSLKDEIDLSFTADDSMPPGIEEDYYDSEGDVLILEELLSNKSLSLLENESFLFYIPSPPRPPAKLPTDDEIKPNSGMLTVKVVGDIFEQYVPLPRLLPTQPTFVSNQEKSPHLLSHRGLNAFSLPLESLMMIYGGNIHILDVPFLYFYTP